MQVAHTLASIPSSISEFQRVGLKLEDLQNPTILQGRAIKLEDLGVGQGGNVSQVSFSRNYILSCFVFSFVVNPEGFYSHAFFLLLIFCQLFAQAL